ncbi:MAG TPA: LuxR C-terminal-related transcriptional regulator [Candidatus Baltobacteraceae bacterium]|nr:LuxR C-terminal-related transcriptional regulator [Candidatus Baltobacteraceae bacterium]
MRAWFAGDFEDCLALCERVRPDGIEMRSEIALLRARALLRVARPQEAIDVVRSVFVAHGTLDASLTARMLLGQAYVRLGDAERGLAILEEARGASAAAHPTIRSEIALGIALAHYGVRRLDEAERALDEVSPDADIVHARALEYRAWIAAARSDYAQATEHFRAVLQRLDACRHRDRFLEANATFGLAAFTAERLDRQGWLIVEHRRARIEWSGSALNGLQSVIALAASKMYDIDGRVREALQAAREAEAVAPNAGYALLAQCRRAAVFRLAGERFAHADAAARLRDALDALDPAAWRDTAQHNLLLAVAEEVAYAGDVLSARALLKRYAELPASPLFSLSGNTIETALRAFVEAVIADVEGAYGVAHRHYRDAFRLFAKVGYERRALLTALRLGELTGHAYLFEYVDHALRKLAHGSPLRERGRRMNPELNDPVLTALSLPERSVLKLLCDGKTTREIASARRRSAQTIRNTVSRILRAFAVPDRAALVRECVRRGIAQL